MLSDGFIMEWNGVLGSEYFDAFENF